MMLAARTAAWAKSGGGMPTARDYVQDGLIAMWDGIENAGWGVHDPNSTVWKDLIHGIELVSQGGNAWGDNYLQVNEQWITKQKTDFDYLETAFIEAPVISGGGYTIEFCGLIDSDSGKNVFGDRYINVSIFVSQNLLNGWLGTGEDTKSSLTINEDGCVSFIVRNTGGGFENVSYVNGMVSNEYSRTSYHNGKISSLFGVGKGEYTSWGGATGKYRSVRMYSRSLTAEEIAHNYAIDKARFNLP